MGMFPNKNHPFGGTPHFRKAPNISIFVEWLPGLKMTIWYWAFLRAFLIETIVWPTHRLWSGLVEKPMKKRSPFILCLEPTTLDVLGIKHVDPSASEMVSPRSLAMALTFEAVDAEKEMLHSMSFCVSEWVPKLPRFCDPDIGRHTWLRVLYRRNLYLFVGTSTGIPDMLSKKPWAVSSECI